MIIKLSIFSSSPEEAIHSENTQVVIEGVTHHGNFKFQTEVCEDDREIELSADYSIHCITNNDLKPSSSKQQYVSRSPFVHLNAVSNKSLQCVLESWGMGKHVILPIYGQVNGLFQVLINVMRVAKAYGCPIACLYLGKPFKDKINFTAAGVSVIRVLSNVNENVDIEGDVCVSNNTDDGVFYTQYILANQSDADLIQVFKRLPNILCVLYNHDNDSLFTTKEVPTLRLQSIEGLNPMDIQRKSAGYFHKLIGKGSHKIRQTVGIQICQRFPGVQRLGAIVGRPRKYDFCSSPLYYIYEKSSFLQQTLAATDAKHIIILDLASVETNMSYVFKLLDRLRGLCDQIILDPHALMLGRAFCNTVPTSKDTTCLTSLSALKQRTDIEFNSIIEDQCLVETMTLPYINEYVDTYLICTENTVEYFTDAMSSAEVVHVTFVGKDVCTISQRGTDYNGAERYPTKADFVIEFVYAYVTKQYVTLPTDSVFTKIWTLQLLNNFNPPLIMQMATSIFYESSNSPKMPTVMFVKELIKVGSESPVDKQNIAKILTQYLQLTTTESFDTVLLHPKTSYIFAKKAEKIGEGNGIISMDDLSSNYTENVCYIASILCHLGQTTALSALLLSTKHKSIVAHLLYAVGILKHKQLQKTEKPHVKERLLQCQNQLEKLAETIMHDSSTRDIVLAEDLLGSEEVHMENSVIDLAIMADSKPFLCEPACKKHMLRRWWGHGYEEPWWKLPALVLENICTKESIPAMKFFFSAVSFLMFMVLYSISVLTGSYTQMNTVEYVILAWMIVLFVEEVRQMKAIFNVNMSLAKNWELYIFDFWNVVDWTMFLVYALGFILRLISYYTGNIVLLTAAHSLLALDALVIFIRSLQFLSMHKIIGPLLITVLHMCEDLAYFIMILLVVLLGYGVALQSILHPTSPLSGSLLFYIIQIPYEQIYGQLAADEIMVATNFSTLSIPDTDPAFRNYFALVLADLYLLFTNVLLLSLLIAKFNTSYESVHKESGYHNIVHMHEVVLEYENKSAIPPPFVAVFYPFNLVKFVHRLANNNNTVSQRDKGSDGKSESKNKSPTDEGSECKSESKNKSPTDEGSECKSESKNKSPTDEGSECKSESKNKSPRDEGSDGKSESKNKSPRDEGSDCKSESKNNSTTDSDEKSSESIWEEIVSDAIRKLNRSSKPVKSPTQDENTNLGENGLDKVKDEQVRLASELKDLKNDIKQMLEKKSKRKSRKRTKIIDEIREIRDHILKNN